MALWNDTLVLRIELGSVSFFHAYYAMIYICTSYPVRFTYKQPNELNNVNYLRSNVDQYSYGLSQALLYK